MHQLRMICHQVKRFLCKTLAFKHIFRYSHIDQLSASTLYPLQNRKLIKVAGDDANRFLHGLVTNDMEHFSQGATSLYAMFLNNKGRVLFDTLIYKWRNKQSYMLECDESVLADLKKHLKVYKLRSAVQIEDMNTQFKIWVLLPSQDLKPECKSGPKDEVNIYQDPRLSDLGYRVISSNMLDCYQVASHINNDIQVINTAEDYKYLRYRLGVSEGADDLPPGTCFPLEANCDYLHGVSFHKGCYIGQEVTARVHHTGVVRKRIMPLRITELVDSIEKDALISVIDKPKSNLGKVKGYIRDYALGLVRTKEALEAKTLIVGKSTIEPEKPAWWPVEAPKEITTVKKAKE